MGDKEHSKVWQFYKDHHLGTKTHEYRDSSTTTTTIRMACGTTFSPFSHKCGKTRFGMGVVGMTLPSGETNFYQVGSHTKGIRR